MELRSGGSVTRWIRTVRAGADASGSAVRNLWDRYGGELERAAGAILERRPSGRAVADEQDAALAGFHAFCCRLAGGGYLAVSNRVELRKLLFRIAANKARIQARDLGRPVRGGGRILYDENLGAEAAGAGGIERIADPGLDPLETIVRAEAYRRRLERLGDNATLRRIVDMKLDGYTHEEIARDLGCDVRTVERKVAIVREVLGDAGS